MMELSKEELSELPLFGVNYQPNSFKRKESESKRVLYYNGFNKENKESEKYFESTIFDDDTYKQPQRGNKNAKVKSVKPKKTFPKSSKEAVMGKEIPMADYLHTLRNVTQIIIIDLCSFLLSCEELIERRDALTQVFGEKVPHRMKIAIINKSDESSSKLEEWRTELEDNNIEIIDHLQRSDYEFLFENPVELLGDFWRKRSKDDMLKLLKLGGDVGIIISNELGLKEDDDAENVVDVTERMSNWVKAEDRNDTIKFVPEDILHEGNLHKHKDSDDIEDGVLASLDIRSLEEKMNVVPRPKGWRPKIYTPEAENPTARIREAHPAGAAPIHQSLLSENFNLILHALVNYIRLHAMNAFIVPGSHLVRHPIWTSEVYVIIRIFENGEEIIRRLFKNKKRQHAEDVCLEALKDIEKDKNTDNWRKMMYDSYSPCHLCRPKIIEFITEKEIFFGLRFHTLFQMNRASCKKNNCNCQPILKETHDQNKQEFIDMKDNPYIDSIGIVAADERRELSEVLQLNLSEDILQELNQLKHKDDIELALDAKNLGILKGGRGRTETADQGLGVDLVDGVNGRPVTENGVNNNLTEKMNVVLRLESWCHKIHTPEEENPTARKREAHPADNDLQREEDKLDEATGGAEIGR